MAYPNFSEFSFGYAVVRQIEEMLGGMVAVPTFPTQPQEFDGGYDVTFLSHGIPLFIQFKRSEVMRRKSCNEWKDNKAGLSLPIFRMHLHRNNEYRQHFLMQELEAQGHSAIYCTSSVINKEMLDYEYASGRALNAAATFLPSEIALPSLTDPHHVSFDNTSDRACVYSDTGQIFQRSMVGFDALLAKLRNRLSSAPNVELQRLAALSADFETVGASVMAERRRGASSSLAANPDDVFDRDILQQMPKQVGESPAFRRSRIRDIESVVKRVALDAYFELDAFLVSVSRQELSK